MKKVNLAKVESLPKVTEQVCFADRTLSSPCSEDQSERPVKKGYKESFKVGQLCSQHQTSSYLLKILVSVNVQETICLKKKSRGGGGA